MWRGKEKVSYTDRVKNEEVFHTVNDERNILCTVKKKDNWIGDILRSGCLLKRIIEGMIK
jgi:hypothetical protein